MTLQLSKALCVLPVAFDSFPQTFPVREAAQEPAHHVQRASACGLGDRLGHVASVQVLTRFFVQG